MTFKTDDDTRSGIRSRFGRLARNGVKPARKGEAPSPLLLAQQPIPEADPDPVRLSRLRTPRKP